MGTLRKKRLSMEVKLTCALILAACGMGCSHSNLIGQRQRQQAPTSAKDVGIVLQNTNADEVQTLLKQNPQAQVRVLNPEHGLYEIFGVSAETAQAAISGKATPNTFFERNHDDRIQDFAIPAPVGLQLGKLNPCKAGNPGNGGNPGSGGTSGNSGSGGPTAKIESLEPLNLMGQTIELGKKVRVSGAGSQANASAPPPALAASLRTAIVIASPASSATPEKIVDANVADFTPDALGLYQVFVVVQDRNDLCSLEGLRFIVTANRAYVGPKQADPAVDLKQFSHLAVLQAPAAWQLSQGEGVTIAILDTGVDYNYPSLAPNIKTNDGEIPGNQVDDEKDGFIDNYFGYDFVNDDAFPYDDDSHGTHVGALAASSQFGLAKKAKILPIKALSPLGGDVATIAAALMYAVDHGANIVNMSLGGSGPTAHPAIVAAVAYAEQKNVLIVAAAGNGDPNTGLGFDIDQTPEFPASLPNANLVTVASFDSENVLSVYSNFGAQSVDVVAPGGSKDDPMISAAFENPRRMPFIGMVGTSMATPVVSGIAADIMSMNPSLSLKDVKQILIGAGTEVPDLKAVTVSGRHINALSALEMANQKNVLF